MVSVSVIIPAYNAGRFIDRAIGSVLQQSFKDYEIIVVDDGSVDNTKEVVNRYRDKLLYIHQENAGAGSARNKGVSLAKGCYIAFLDADDEWHPEKLHKQFFFLHKNPNVKWIFTELSESKDGKLTHELYLRELHYKNVAQGCIFESLLRECFIFTPTVLVQKEALEKVGLFDHHLKTFEDFDLWLRLSRHYPVGFLDEPLVTRHVHDVNLTLDRSLVFQGYSEVMEKLQREANLSPALRRFVKRELANWYKLAGVHYLRLGESQEAASLFRKSLRNLMNWKTAAYFMLSKMKDGQAESILRSTGRASSFLSSKSSNTLV